MDEPSIQYMRSSDGADIACWTLEKGWLVIQMSSILVLLCERSGTY